MSFFLFFLGWEGTRPRAAMAAYVAPSPKSVMVQVCVGARLDVRVSGLPAARGSTESDMGGVD